MTFGVIRASLNITWACAERHIADRGYVGSGISVGAIRSKLRNLGLLDAAGELTSLGARVGEDSAGVVSDILDGWSLTSPMTSQQLRDSALIFWPYISEETRWTYANNLIGLFRLAGRLLE